MDSITPVTLPPTPLSTPAESFAPALPASPAAAPAQTAPDSQEAQVTDLTQQAQQRREQAVAQAAQAIQTYPLGDQKLDTIYKDADSGQYVARYTNLRDGSVSEVPEQTLLTKLETAPAPLLSLNA